ncbi:MAG: TetR/AcrR family transcriptional regulator [Lachnospiraceae bacterium]|nr:TetR/AcrR family transcriptional regulator [Lachnospiraceae bacterium]
MEDRRSRILREGFSLFSTKSIETISLQEVADASHVGIATLYRYYEKKRALAAAIGDREWSAVYQEVVKEFMDRDIASKTAAEMFEFYLDCYLWLFREHKQLLKFHGNYCSYIFRDQAEEGWTGEFEVIAKRFSDMFHLLYLKAQQDKSLRTDLSEKKLFSMSMHIMLNLAAKYAEGLLYGEVEEEDRYEELVFTKNLILNACLPQ